MISDKAPFLMRDLQDQRYLKKARTSACERRSQLSDEESSGEHGKVNVTMRNAQKFLMVRTKARTISGIATILHPHVMRRCRRVSWIAG